MGNMSDVCRKRYYSKPRHNVRSVASDLRHGRHGGDNLPATMAQKAYSDILYYLRRLLGCRIRNKFLP